MAHTKHLVELSDLQLEVWRHLQPSLCCSILDCHLHVGVVRVWQLDPGEKVADDPLEESNVVAEELAEVDVHNGPKHQLILVVRGVLALEVACRPQHRHHGPHSVVIVVLAAQLLAAQAVRLHQLLPQQPSLEVAKRVQNDLRDKGVVGNHHCHITEQCLEVVRELRAASISRVHGDEDIDCDFELQLHTLKNELLGVGGDRPLDGEHLLCDHREDLELNAIELIKAGPSSTGREALEELPHREVVQAVGAVEDDALDGHRLGQVLGGLRLAGAGGAGRGAPEVKVDGTQQSSVAAVCEGCDDQPAAVPEVLVAVPALGIEHADKEVVLLPVVPQAALPVKVRVMLHLVLNHLHHDIPAMDINDHEGAQSGALQGRQLPSD
mmetsp:Transcript_13243/g.37392  ORF Transcript_13243/g.37392 Transcript_13243/m.37392 type:complete len:381 (+) Transcript_13243:7435-8577(+)